MGRIISGTIIGDVYKDPYKIGDVKRSFLIGDGWLPCDGSVYLRDEYGILSSSIGYINRYDWHSYQIGDYYSENGIPNQNSAADFKFLNNRYIILSARAKIISESINGINWTIHSIPSIPGTGDDPWRSVAYGNGIYVIVSDEYCSTSADLVTWSVPYKFNIYNDGLGNGFPVSSIDFGNNIFVVAAGNYILTSNSGATNWIKRTTPLNMELIKIIFFNNMTDPNESYFITICSCRLDFFLNLNKGVNTYNNPGADSAIMYSKDGITWDYVIFTPIFTNPTKYWGGFTNETDRFSSYSLNEDYRPIPSNIVKNKYNNDILIAFANEAFFIRMYWDSLYPANGSAHPFAFRYRTIPIADDWGPILFDAGIIIVSRFGTNTLVISNLGNDSSQYEIKQLPVPGRCVLAANTGNPLKPDLLLDNTSNYVHSYIENYDMNTEFAVPDLNTRSDRYIIKYQ